MSKPTIAILGASTQRHKFGNKAVRAYASRGYDVFAVNPNASTVEGRPAYASVRDVPAGRLDRVSIYLPPEVGLRALTEVADREVGEVWLNPGADSARVIARAKELGLNVVVGCSILDVGVNPHDLD